MGTSNTVPIYAWLIRADSNPVCYCIDTLRFQKSEARSIDTCAALSNMSVNTGWASF